MSQAASGDPAMALVRGRSVSSDGPEDEEIAAIPLRWPRGERDLDVPPEAVVPAVSRSESSGGTAAFDSRRDEHAAVRSLCPVAIDAEAEAEEAAAVPLAVTQTV